MSLGNKLLELRKSKQLSQEELADKLNVTRQTISKWETDQSTPDFDKIIPLCELYEITADELLKGKKVDQQEEQQIEVSEDEGLRKRKIASGIGRGILLYFVAIVWIMISIPVLMINPIIASAIFLLICGVATYLIIYTCIIYSKKKEKPKKKDKLRKQIEEILSIFTIIIYLLISFLTSAWYITWIIWIVYALIIEILKLIFMLRGEKNE